MVKQAFIISCSLIVGALVVEYKQYFAHEIPVPIATLPDGGVYNGELRKGLLGGEGRITWPNKSYYEGGFVDGLYHGKGVLHTRDSFYEGDFEHGNAKGEGIIKFVNGDTYTGEVDLSRPSGSGVLESADGSRYTGEFKDGLYHGQGELKYTQGDLYIGAFSKGLFHGDGVYTRQIEVAGKKAPNNVKKVIYSGTFVKGQLTGEGIWVDGERRYEGQFLDWKFHGEGLYSDPRGTYNGKFSMGAYEGKGVYMATDGLVYEGGFVSGRYEGKGVLSEANGDKYTGAFEYGMKHGDGSLVYHQPLDGIQRVKGQWEYDKLVEADHPRLAVSHQTLAEHALYNQSALLERDWKTLLAQDPEKIDMYFVGVAGDGSQAVFRREMDFVHKMFEEEYLAKGKAISLVNSPFSYEEKPLATLTSIQRTLENVAQQMDKDNDILFVYLSSHGSKDFTLQLAQPGLDLEGLSAEALGAMLKSLPVKHKVVVISACFAGGFVTKVKDDHMLIITAAEADKASFGCHDRAEMTYFGEAFFKDALPQSESFVDAFYRARDIIRGREAKEGFEYSNPLIFKSKAIVKKLQAWREQLAKDKDNSVLLTKKIIEK